MSTTATNRTSFLPTQRDLAQAARDTIARGGGAAPARGVLLLTSGAEAGRVFPVEGSLSIGRGRDSTIRFEDASLSRVHARVRREGDRYVLEDAGSLNGCFVNDVRAQSVVLSDGDRIRVGSALTLRFHTLEEHEERALMKAYDSSLRDGLTGLLNRRYVEDRLLTEVSYARRHGTELSAILVDLDHFKQINDTAGHLGGDAVLKHVSSLLLSLVRAEDVVARFGGEELLILARGTPLRGAAEFAERLRRAIEAAHVVVDGRTITVTASIGVASLACAGEASVAGLIARADERLYRAKEGGRNRVVAR